MASKGNIRFRLKRAAPVWLAIGMLAGLTVWQPFWPNAFAVQDASDLQRLFKQLGIVQTPPIAPPENFALKDLDGRQIRLSDLKGKVVLLNFWTTWCPDCIREMPALERLHQRFKQSDFILLAVDLREPGNKVRQFFSRHNLTFTALLDENGRVARSFGIRAIPTTFIIDSSGAIIGKAIGSRTWDSAGAVALIDALINAAVPLQGSGEEEGH